MNAGSHVEAFIGNSPCKIVETRPDKAICITGPSERLDKAEVKMIFDKVTYYNTTWVNLIKFNFLNLFIYSKVPNKRTGPNKSTGGNFCQIQ